MTMRSNDLLLGFDAREMWMDFSQDWSEERKRSFLLRRDIVKPLSTDTTVWQSVFKVDQTLQRPQWIGPTGQLWENLPALEQYVSTAWNKRREPYWVIAITLPADIASDEERAYWNDRRGEIMPSVADPSWHLLGYDVADSYLLSGLTNLGYGDDEVQDIGPKYLPFLNEYHLFQSVEPAAEFIHRAEEGARAHAPFFVFGLWLIKKEV